MKVENIKGIKIKLKGDNSNNFKSALKKICDIHKKPGFTSTSLSEEEIKVLQGVSDKLNN